MRRAAGLTQTELAQLVGESQPNIAYCLLPTAYWEQSERPPRSDVLPKLAKVLGVKIEQILADYLAVVDELLGDAEIREVDVAV